MVRLEKSSLEEMMQHGVSVQDINQALSRRDRNVPAVVGKDGVMFWLCVPVTGTLNDPFVGGESFTLQHIPTVWRGHFATLSENE